MLVVFRLFTSTVPMSMDAGLRGPTHLFEGRGKEWAPGRLWKQATNVRERTIQKLGLERMATRELEYGKLDWTIRSPNR